MRSCSVAFKLKVFWHEAFVHGYLSNIYINLKSINPITPISTVSLFSAAYLELITFILNNNLSTPHAHHQLTPFKHFNSRSMPTRTHALHNKTPGCDLYGLIVFSQHDQKKQFKIKTPTEYGMNQSANQTNHIQNSPDRHRTKVKSPSQNRRAVLIVKVDSFSGLLLRARLNDCFLVLIAGMGML